MLLIPIEGDGRLVRDFHRTGLAPRQWEIRIEHDVPYIVIEKGRMSEKTALRTMRGVFRDQKIKHQMQIVEEEIHSEDAILVNRLTTCYKCRLIITMIPLSLSEGQRIIG